MSWVPIWYNRCILDIFTQKKTEKKRKENSNAQQPKSKIFKDNISIYVVCQETYFDIKEVKKINSNTYYTNKFTDVSQNNSYENRKAHLIIQHYKYLCDDRMS